MSYWQELYDKKNFARLDHWWRHEASDTEARDFYNTLMRDIPKVERRNGMEQEIVPVPSAQADREWRVAARILEFGELESRVFEFTLSEERPSSCSHSEIVKDASLLWQRTKDSVLSELARIEQSPEQTTGSPTLSRAAHISEVRSTLEQLELLSNAAIAAMGSDASDRDWQRETLAEVAHLAFVAGVSYRATLGKSIEGHAVRGEKNLKSAKLGGEMTRARAAADSQEILKEMKMLLAAGYTVSDAARKIGRDRNKHEKTIAQIYYRHRDRK